ncbi:MAG: hypothetical protein ABW061_24500 [Polyangiaceae bacterium]
MTYDTAAHRFEQDDLGHDARADRRVRRAANHGGLGRERTSAIRAGLTKKSPAPERKA